MAPKKKVVKPKPPTLEQRVDSLENELLATDHVAETQAEEQEDHGIQLGDHERRIGILEADLLGRDLVIWAILNQHNERIAALKFALFPIPPDEEEIVPVEEPRDGDDAKTGFWSWFIGGLLLVALIGLLLYLRSDHLALLGI